MSIHVLKQVIQLLPEVSGMVKRAHVEEEFPLNTKDAAISSALQVTYLTKVAHQPVDGEVMTKVARAVRLYGVGDEVQSLSNKLIKQAHQARIEVKNTEQLVKEAETIIESNMQGLFDMQKVASASSALFDEYEDHISSPAVRLYAGAGLLNKEAAVAALNYRTKMTGNDGFNKIAQIVQGSRADRLSVDDNRALVRAIVDMEKTANYQGRDIYKEIFLVKEAAIQDATLVNLGSKSVKVTQLKALGSKSVGDILGADIGKVIDLPAIEMKHALEALPVGEKQALARLIR